MNKKTKPKLKQSKSEKGRTTRLNKKRVASKPKPSLTKKKVSTKKNGASIKGRFTKGNSGNVNGRPKGTKNKYSIADLAAAVKVVEKRKKVSILETFVERALTSDVIMVALMRKILPDLKSIEAIIGTLDAKMDEDVAKGIQDKLRKRYGS